jgi:hypothetical protein
MGSSMLRNIVAAVVGYIVLFTLAFLLSFLMWTVLGADRAFVPGQWQISGVWIAGSLVVGLIVSILGGFTCSKLSENRLGVVFLVMIVISMGILSALPEGTTVVGRPDSVTMFDAMANAQLPT